MRDYYYIITLQYKRINGLTVSTRSGIFTPAPGMTREDCAKQVFQQALVSVHADWGAILFFSLEPNDLEG